MPQTNEQREQYDNDLKKLLLSANLIDDTFHEREIKKLFSQVQKDHDAARQKWMEDNPPEQVELLVQQSADKKFWETQPSERKPVRGEFTSTTADELLDKMKVTHYRKRIFNDLKKSLDAETPKVLQTPRTKPIVIESNHFKNF